MDYQQICAAIEVPLNNAFAGLFPPVKIYFDNLIVLPPDAPGEYVLARLAFGMTTESALTQTLSFARGAMVIEIYVQKGNGPFRARRLSQVAFSVLQELGQTQKPASGIFVRVRDVTGPRFFMDQEQPHFVARIDASWQATDLG